MYGRLLGVLFLLALAAVQLPRPAEAVPAAPVIHTVSQPDGTVLQIRQWGDERTSGFESEEGYTIIRDEASGVWYYAEKAPDGSLAISSLQVGRDFPPADLPRHLRPYRAPISEPSDDPAAGKQLGKTVAATTVSGTKKIPVILANFTDTSFTYSAGNFNSLLFGTGNMSMKDYYLEVSYGALTVATDGIVGPVTVRNGHNYYGADSGSTKDLKAADFVYEAIMAADAQVNFTAYSENGSCTVDNVVIVHQGTGQEASPNSTDIWSHRWTLSSAKYFGKMNSSYPGAYTTDDPCPSGGYMKVDGYTIQPEINSDGQMITIGVFAHEYGHVLGLPDLYDTMRLETVPSGGVGYWSLMASGSYGKSEHSGDRPAHPDAWSKFMLGWVTPTQITATMTNEQITAASAAADVYQLLAGTPESGEYFLVENRHKSGFDAGLPGSGLLIWHVDGSYVSAHLKSNDVNNLQCIPPGDCSAGHYGVALVPSDGKWELEQNASRGDVGDPYPGSSGNTSFTNSSTPNSKLWSGAASNVSITGISGSGQTMTATFSLSAGSCSYDLPVSSQAIQSTSTTGSFQLVTVSGCTWTAVSNASWLTITSGSSGTGSGTVAYSVAANTSSSSRQGTITAGGKTYTVTQAATATGSGSTTLLLNGDFELGRVSWTEYSSGGYIIISSQNLANHGGYWSANLGGYNSAYESIRQTVTIPSGAGEASLSFWYRIATKEPVADSIYDSLSVKLLDQYDANNVIADLGSLSNLNSGTTYNQYTGIDLTPYKGRTVQVAFVASTDLSYPTTFLIDDVTLTTSNGTSLSITPAQRLYAAGSGTGSFDVAATGAWNAVSDASWVTVSSGASGTNNGTVSFSIGANGTASLRKAHITIGDKTFTVMQVGTSGVQNLVTNGGFESGSSGWSESSSGGLEIITNNPGYLPKSGSYYAWLGGYNYASDLMWRSITIPATAAEVYLQYDYSVSTKETTTDTEYDRLYVYLSDPATFEIIEVFRSYSNLDGSTFWNSSDAIDLSAYKGRTLDLVFGAVTDQDLITSFLLDNVEVKALTDSVAPVVNSVIPAENAENVAVSTTISATMSKQINPATLGSASFVVKQGSSVVPGSIVYDSATMKATFTPYTQLEHDKIYSVSLKNDIRDISNNALTAKNWIFKTDVAPNTYTITISASAGGSISPSTQQTVSGGDTKTFAITPSNGNLFQISGCGGTLNGYSYTTAAINTNCTVTVNFVRALRDGLLITVSGKTTPDINDALRALKMAAGMIVPTIEDLSHGDIAPLNPDGSPKGDSKIDFYDVIAILRKSVGL